MTSKSRRIHRPRWHYIITITWTDTGGIDRMVTDTGSVAPLPGHTRERMFEFLYDRAVRDAGAAESLVLFFSLEPDDLYQEGRGGD